MPNPSGTWWWWWWSAPVNTSIQKLNCIRLKTSLSILRHYVLANLQWTRPWLQFPQPAAEAVGVFWTAQLICGAAVIFYVEVCSRDPCFESRPDRRLHQGCPTRGTSGCVMRSAATFLSCRYYKQLHNNLGGLAIHLVWFLHVHQATTIVSVLRKNGWTPPCCTDLGLGYSSQSVPQIFA